MPWSTKRTINKGPSRHILRLLLLVVLAWILIYTLTTTTNNQHAPDAKTLRQQNPHAAEHASSMHDHPPQWAVPDGQKPAAAAADIIVGGPQIGSAKIDINAAATHKAQELKDHSSSSSKDKSEDRPPQKPAASAFAIPPKRAPSPLPHDPKNNNHGSSSSSSSSQFSKPAPPSPYLKTAYTLPLSAPYSTGLPTSAALTKRTVQHLLLTPSSRSSLTTATSTTTDDGPSLLILVMTRDEFSWGKHEGKLRRLQDFLAMVQGALHEQPTGLKLEDVALGLLTSGEKEWAGYAEVLEGWGAADDEDGERLGGVHLIRHPGYMRAEGDGEDGEAAREARHQNDLQHDRRAEMAKLRNYLMQSALGTVGRRAAEVLWMDADVFELSEGLIGDMRKGMAEHAEVGVLTALCTINGADYDLNAWRGTRSSPNEEQRKKLRAPGGMGSWVASLQGVGQMSDLVGKDEEREEVQRVFRENVEKEMDRMAAEQDEKERREIEAEIAERYSAEEKRLREVENWVNSMSQEERWKSAEGQEKPREDDQGGGEHRLVSRESAFVPGEAEFESGDDDDDDKPEDAEKAKDSKDANSDTEKTDDSSSSETGSEEKEDGDLPDFFRLDAVGATVLMMRADLVRQGLTFATSYLVGTDWEAEGWDAIESEGLCITARTLGSGCWGIKKGHSKHVTG